MKTINLLFALAIIYLPLFAFSETEPNNNYSSANVLSVNSSDAGTLTSSTDADDWWKVTITADGELDINTTASVTGMDIDLYLYDVNGTTLLAGYEMGSQITERTHYNNLLPGTYFVKAHLYSTISGSYTISSTFTPTGLTNDTENNDSMQVAITLPLNGSITGHLGFYSNGYTDRNDWWKVIIPSDGKLVVNTTSDATLDIDLFLFDVNGTTQIAGYDTSVGIHEATHFNNLMPGTYYVRAFDYHSSGYGSYTISSSYTPTAYTNDTQNNDSVQVATILPLNVSITGHLGFYSNGYTDRNDWWKVIIPSDGKLVVNTTSDATLDIDLFLFDVNGTTQIAGYDTSVGIHEATHFNNLMPGTYYVRAFDCHSDGYGSYTISSSFTPTAYTNDTENNDSVQVAAILPLNGSSTGHLGFYTNGYTDLVDWWKVTVTSSGDNLVINSTSDATLDIDLYLYGTDGITQIAGYDTSVGIHEATHYNNISTGTYYVKAYNYNGGDYGSYTISSVLYTPTGITNTQIPSNEVSVFPNPTSGKFTVSSPEKVNTIEVFNMLGEKVYMINNLKQPTPVNSQTSYKIDFSNFQKGIYFVNIYAGQKMQTKKIVIQ